MATSEVYKRKRRQFFENTLAALELITVSVKEARAADAEYMPDDYRKRLATASQQLRDVLMLPPAKPRILLCTRSKGPSYRPNRIAVHRNGCPKAPANGQESGPYVWQVSSMRLAWAHNILASYQRLHATKMHTNCRSCGGLSPQETEKT